MEHKPIPIPHVRCQQCGHEWIPRKPYIQQCSRCQSKRWNEPKVQPKEAVSR